mmetsp:Transcript_25355/g.81390  ORF Transcript_25355/g.81390 Transcript_25355/m.81390 type:complete len:265 (-) Transcript_25355:639-1433(-)
MTVQRFLQKRVSLWVCACAARSLSSKVSEVELHTGLGPRRAARIGAYQETGQHQRCRHAPMTRPPSIAFIGSNSIPFHPRSVRSRSSSGTPVCSRVSLVEPSSCLTMVMSTVDQWLRRGGERGGEGSEARRGVKGEEGRRRGEERGARRVERRGDGRWGGERRGEVQQRRTPRLPLGCLSVRLGCLSVASRLHLGCHVEKRHFHLITARSPSKGLSSAFSPSTAPENIISLPPTSVDMLASEAVMPRMRCVSSSVSYSTCGGGL